jgi:acyl-CoA reductase-like NAD-dependent aldehyde dehydrogenase
MTVKQNDDLLSASDSITDGKSIETENPLYALHQAIAAMPDVDPEKVAAVIKKLQNGELALLSDDPSQRSAAANRIAARIMEESLGVASTKTED